MTVEDLQVSKKRVLLRLDLNVPLNDNGEITDDTRIQAALKTICYLLTKGASLVLMSHLGRPRGEENQKFSLEPCAKRLHELLKIQVPLAPDCIGEEVKRMAEHLKPGEVLLLENLRFHRAEEHPDEDPSFAKKLAELGDVYVNDAFGAAHRDHASITRINSFFPGTAAMGFLMQEEIFYLDKILKGVSKPFYALFGGAKVSGKLGVIRSFLTKADAIFIGGGMAYTFLRAQGIEIGDSICEEDLFDEARQILDEAARREVPIYLPEDIVIANRIAEDAKSQIVQASEGIPLGCEGLDIGPRTIGVFIDKLQDGKTIFWNGPLGVFEISEFAKGTMDIARGIADLDAVTIIGGGDSLFAVRKAGLQGRYTHLSTGGGASLKYLEKGVLPGIEALSSKNEYIKK